MGEDHIYLSSLSGKQYELGVSANTETNDNSLSGSEISVFLEACEKAGCPYNPSPLKKIAQQGKKWLEAAKQKMFNTKNVENDDYKNHPRYQEVRDLAEKTFFKKNKSYKSWNSLSTADREKFQNNIELATKMVLEMSDKYEVADLAPVFIQMICHESGFDFDYTLEKKNSQYKGVMQVGIDAICSIYGQGIEKPIDRGDGKLIKSSYSNDAYEAEQKRCLKKDIERINELKKKYPTPESLYEAIKTDVELGVEVGILTYKIKLAYSKGNVAAAQKKYCCGQYTCEIPTTVPRTVIT